MLCVLKTELFKFKITAIKFPIKLSFFRQKAFKPLSYSLVYLKI